MRSSHSPAPTARLGVIATAWVIALVAVLAARFRGDWSAYRGIHRSLADLGIPDIVRNFDGLLLYLVASLIAAWISTRLITGTALARLGLERGRPGWPAMVVVALLPMVAGGVVLLFMRGGIPSDADSIWPRVVRGVVRAPIMEELLYRGVLIGVIACAIGWTGARFWLNALLAAALFASTHVDWNLDAVARGWPTLLVTGLGGLWYAWLLARWRTLWVPMALHAGMNLGWMIAGASGGAGGGGLAENLLRVATIVIACWWTLRRTPAPRP